MEGLGINTTPLTPAQLFVPTILQNSIALRCDRTKMPNIYANYREDKRHKPTLPTPLKYIGFY